jgi:hypothetical protein
MRDADQAHAMLKARAANLLRGHSELERSSANVLAGLDGLGNLASPLAAFVPRHFLSHSSHARTIAANDMRVKAKVMRIIAGAV